MNYSTFCSPDAIIRLQDITDRITVDSSLIKYAVALVQSTRQFHGISMGAGPRGSIALISAAKAEALQNGRDYVIPDDIIAMALPVLRHRIALTPDMELEQYTPDDVLKTVIGTIDAPRQ